MSIFLDGIVLLTLVIFVLIGIRRGIVRTALNLVGMIASAFMSSYFAKIVAQWVYTTFFKDSIINSVTEAINENVGESAQTVADAIVDKLPWLAQILIPNADTSEITKAIENGSSTIANAVETAVSPLIIGLISVIATILLFILFSIFFRWLARLISGHFRVPVLNSLNKALGGVFQLISGSVIIMFVIFVTKIISNISGDQAFLTEQMANDTILFKWFYHINIFDFIFSSLLK